MENNPFPILGTAMWGWTTPKEICFKLLDSFYSRGFRQVDTATNYPINKIKADFRKSEKILQEWILVNGISDLEVIVKTGSLSNAGSAENNLSKSFLLLVLDEYEFLFHDNLDTFSVHWDNRNEVENIRDTFESFQIASKKGLNIGLSGIKHPEIYAKINKSYNFNFRIQIKHNLFYSDFERYAPLHTQAGFLTYGINAGGLKLNTAAYNDSSSIKVRGGITSQPHPVTPALHELFTKANQDGSRPEINDFNQCGLCYAWHQKGVEGILIGTSKVEQLNQSLDFLEILSKYDFTDVYNDLKAISQTIQ